jgi:NADH-quinone oxidoreductase subunit C
VSDEQDGAPAQPDARPEQSGAGHMLTALTDAGIAATGSDSFGVPTVDVPADAWVAAHELLRDEVGLIFFDFLTASDELTDGFRLVTHLADFWGGAHVDHLLVRTLIPRADAALPTLSEVYAGANWHERETHEMFGIDFPGHPNLVPLLLPDEFEGNPLRKEFVLASRVAKPWPGAKEPGESDHATPKTGAPSRRRTLPPGVPDPETWGPRPPGSPDPDPLAPAQAASTPARPRRAGATGERRTRKAAAPSTPSAEPAPPADTPAAARSTPNPAASADASPDAAPTPPNLAAPTPADEAPDNPTES